MQCITTRNGRMSTLFLLSLLSILFLCACSVRMPGTLPQSDLQKPTVIDIYYYGSARYSYTEYDSGYEEIFNTIEATWLSDKSLKYRTASSYDSATLRGVTRIYFIYESPIECMEGEYIEKYEGYCFLIPENMKADGEFVCFTDVAAIGTDSEKYNGPRYYEFSTDIGEVIRSTISVQNK